MTNTNASPMSENHAAFLAWLLKQPGDRRIGAGGMNYYNGGYEAYKSCHPWFLFCTETGRGDDNPPRFEAFFVAITEVLERFPSDQDCPVTASEVRGILRTRGLA